MLFHCEESHTDTQTVQSHQSYHSRKAETKYNLLPFLPQGDRTNTSLPLRHISSVLGNEVSLFIHGFFFYHAEVIKTFHSALFLQRLHSFILA